MHIQEFWRARHKPTGKFFGTKQSGRAVGVNGRLYTSDLHLISAMKRSQGPKAFRLSEFVLERISVIVLERRDMEGIYE